MIILYIPIFILLSIGHSIFITLIYPLVIIMKRPEYPFYSFSLTVATIYLVYQFIVIHDSIYQLKEPPILKPFNEVLNFTRTCWELGSITQIMRS